MKVEKPFPHESSARLIEPSTLDPKDYQRTHGGSLYGGNVKVPKSIDIIWGKPKGADHVVAQALRFPTSDWTEDKAKKWLKDNNVHSLSFVPATGDVKKADSDVLTEAWDTLAEHYQRAYDNKDRVATVKTAVLFKSVHDELVSRSGVIVRKENVPYNLTGFTIQQKDIRDVTGIIPFTFEVKKNTALVILDREPMPVKGIVTYTLGCVKDSTKPAKDDNLVEVCKVMDFDCGAKLDEVVNVSCESIGIREDGDYFLPVIKALAIERPQKRIAIAKSRDILCSAHANGILETDKEMMIKVAERKIFYVNIEKQFGINFVKEIRFLKTPDSSKMKEGVVYGIVYPVNEVDADGDYATPEEVLRGCWRFMKDYLVMNMLHQSYIPSNQYSIVECACALADAPKYGINEGDWYIAVMLEDPELREMVESGKLSAFSMEGSASPGEEIPSLEAKKRRIS